MEFEYQNSVAALHLGRLCALEVYPRKHHPEEVRVEAPSSVDDTTIRYQDSHREYIQAKVSLLRGTDLIELAQDHQIQIERSPDIESILDAVRHTGDVLRQHRQSIGATGIHFQRDEVDQIVAWVKAADYDNNLGVILEQAGMGKTVTKCDAINRLEADGLIVLAVKADQQLTNVASLDDLKERLHLPDTIDRVVQRIASVYPVVVLFDQIDALSLSMARDQITLDVVLDCVARLRRVPNVRILLSCRSFDLKNDPKLSQISISREFALAPFAAACVMRSYLRRGSLL